MSATAQPSDTTRGERRSLTENTRAALLAAIRAGAFEDGRLPPEAALAERLGVSRTTLRAALQSLAADGLISRRRRHGTVINGHLLRTSMRLNRLVAFTELIEQCGHAASVGPQLQRTDGASARDAEALGIERGAPVLVVERPLRAGSEPVIIVVDVVPVGRLRRAPADVGPADSTFALLVEHGTAPIAYATSEFIPRVATASEPRGLEIAPGEPYIELLEVHYAHVTVAAAAIALQVVLPSLWSGFQLVGDDPAITSSDGATNAVLLGSILIACTTFVNALGVRAVARINTAGVTLELIGIAAMVILLLFHSERGPQAVLHQTGSAPASSYFAAFIVSALMAAYVMVGFDSAGELSEETHEPRRIAPRAILRALWVAGAGGALLLLAGIMAAPSLTDGQLATLGLPYVLTSQLSEPVAKLLLADVAIAVCICTMAIQTAGTRMMFSMARDRMLPGSSQLALVSPRTGTPLLPAILVGVLAVAVMAINVGDASIFTALTSVCIVMLYLAYLMVTAPLLLARLRGGFRPDPSRFSLGRLGLPVNVAAVLYGALMTVNIAWPRASVYDLEGGHWYLRWFAVLFVAATAAVGLLAFLAQRRAAGKPAAELAVAEAG